MQLEARLDRTFHALADPTRRAMVRTLSGGAAHSASELGAQFRSRQPTISRHLKVLEQAELIERHVEGRVHRFRLRRQPLQEAAAWVTRQQSFWSGAMDQLEDLIARGEL
jgi:DNA-binding transcriptional ArsR family regulator